MSAVPREERWLRPMQAAGLEAVLSIESAAYEFPWSRGNFIDSLAAGYWAQWLIGPASTMLGFFARVVDEALLAGLMDLAHRDQQCASARS